MRSVGMSLSAVVRRCYTSGHPLTSDHIPESDQPVRPPRGQHARIWAELDGIDLREVGFLQKWRGDKRSTLPCRRHQHVTSPIQNKARVVKASAMGRHWQLCNVQLTCSSLTLDGMQAATQVGMQEYLSSVTPPTEFPRFSL